MEEGGGIELSRSSELGIKGDWPVYDGCLAELVLGKGCLEKLRLVGETNGG
jgi:hypothetical protein